jgi:rRNA maturation endonuclease Nob1
MTRLTSAEYLIRKIGENLKSSLYFAALLGALSLAAPTLVVAYSSERASDIRTLLSRSTHFRSDYSRYEYITDPIVKLEMNQEELGEVIRKIRRSADSGKLSSREIEMFSSHLEYLKEDQKKLLTENLSDALSKSESQRNNEIYSIQSLAAFIAGAGIAVTLHYGQKIMKNSGF